VTLRRLPALLVAALIAAAVGGCSSPADRDPWTPPPGPAVSPDPADAAQVRQASVRGSRLCLRNGTTDELHVLSWGDGADGGTQPFAPAQTTCISGSTRRGTVGEDDHPWEVMALIARLEQRNGRQVTIVVAKAWAFNPWIGSPWLAFQVESPAWGNAVNHTWSVKDTWTSENAALRLVGTRLPDSDDHKEYTLELLPAG